MQTRKTFRLKVVGQVDDTACHKICSARATKKRDSYIWVDTVPFTFLKDKNLFYWSAYSTSMLGTVF